MLKKETFFFILHLLALYADSKCNFWLHWSILMKIQDSKVIFFNYFTKRKTFHQRLFIVYSSIQCCNLMFLRIYGLRVHILVHVFVWVPISYSLFLFLPNYAIHIKSIYLHNYVLYRENYEICSVGTHTKSLYRQK